MTPIIGRSEIDAALHEQFMRVAIENARLNRSQPYGCVIIDSAGPSIISNGHNRAKENPTWHGEIDAINHWINSNQKIAPERLILYSTAEPCPMCQAAILWSRIGTVVYGTSMETLIRFGWDQITLSATAVCQQASFQSCKLIPGILETECDALFESASKNR